MAAPVPSAPAAGPQVHVRQVPRAAAPVQSNLDAARTILLLTGYEDTEMADDDPMPALSGTQYGELR